ncbi:hypothetical protein GOODEAATRI_012080 [Goodea atripinnis]|uniref:Sushi domain-containing protein n=1 Tax=Goodea atripinnis TaxID=208336 RepID=A0ABV0MH42_9TELE
MSFGVLCLPCDLTFFPVCSRLTTPRMLLGNDFLINPVTTVSCASGGADDNLIEGGEMKFVCKPGARNITVIFQPLLRCRKLY